MFFFESVDLFLEVCAHGVDLVAVFKLHLGDRELKLGSYDLDLLFGFDLDESDDSVLGLGIRGSLIDSRFD